MRDGQANLIRLEDYQLPAFRVPRTTLDVALHDDYSRVTTTLELERHPDAAPAADCILDGVELVLNRLEVDGQPWPADQYHYDGERLVIRGLPDRCTLLTEVTIQPQLNTALEGLYMSRGMYCTQCEAEGFRRITFYPDRPDILSRFVTTIGADKARFPLLLSNGNPIARGEEADGRHWVTWEDPYPKPSYLFALVAGDLACLEDHYQTGSGRTVTLQIYAEPRDLDKLDHAMRSLKAAMAWDERVYGLEYDLDIYMIVAVSHFNMGAMENKGLNIFNTACVLAHPRTTTDAGFQRVESVVGHEYFHNWSGNRVTCRDWFQLSLKEGLTVFRDQCFSADMNSATVKRVEDVDLLRTVQFPEDQGPMAHPVRPAAYQKIDNFYTVTIYEKGAELVRMQHELLGAERFRAGTDLYFRRFDGQAVTTDDFVDCMEEASGLDLRQFRRWYDQAGTPCLTVQDRIEQGAYVLTFRQMTPPTAGQPDKLPLMIPVRLALLGRDGQRLPLPDGGTETVLVLTETEQSFRFPLPPGELPVPSLLRGFSAPVELDYAFTTEQLHFLLAHDDDGYSRWDASQRLYHAAVSRLLQAPDESLRAAAAEEAAALVPALQQVLARAMDDAAAAALLLTLPSEQALADRLPELDIDGVHRAREALRTAIGQQLSAAWWQAEQANTLSGVYQPLAEDIGRRSLRHCALGYLAAAGDARLAPHLMALFQQADNMTDQLGALRLLVHYRLPGADEALAAFAAQWQDEALVMDQWFTVQATVPGEATLGRVQALLAHESFDWRVPNRVRAVLGALANANPTAFHAESGDGYRLYAEALGTLDAVNPQVAARMANACARLPRLPTGRRALLATVLRELLAKPRSANLTEVLERILASNA